MRLRVRWPFVALLAGVAVWGFAAIPENWNRETEVLAMTTCPFRGEPVTTVSPGLSPLEMAHVAAHEAVHAQQCRALGPLKYRIRNLTSKLWLEAPAYCAGAAARLGRGMDSAEVRIRLRDDAIEALRGTADSVDVLDALEMACPEILRRPRPGGALRASTRGPGLSPHARGTTST
jgi:hypothetical protein